MYLLLSLGLLLLWKILDYSTDYKNRSSSSISLMTAVPNTSDRLHCALVCILLSQTHRETDEPAFLQLQELNMLNTTRTNSSSGSFRRPAVYSQLKSKVSIILAKVTDLCIKLDIDGLPITSRTHTHSQTSRLLFTSLSLGTPLPRSTSCMRDFAILQL